MKFIELLKDIIEESCKIRPLTRNKNGDVICFQCGRVAKEHCYTSAGLREVENLGLCEECYDAIFSQEEIKEEEEEQFKLYYNDKNT